MLLRRQLEENIKFLIKGVYVSTENICECCVEAISFIGLVEVKKDRLVYQSWLEPDNAIFRTVLQDPLLEKMFPRMFPHESTIR